MQIKMDHPDDLQALFDAGILTPPNTTGTSGPTPAIPNSVPIIAPPGHQTDSGMPSMTPAPAAPKTEDHLSPGAVSGEKPAEAPAVASPTAKTAVILQAPIQPGSQEDYRQQIAKLEQPKTPWHDLGLGGKIGRVFKTAGNVGLDVFAPDVAALIPGTDIHNRLELNSARRGLAGATREDLERAQAKNLTSEADARKITGDFKPFEGENAIARDKDGNPTGVFGLNTKTGQPEVRPLPVGTSSFGKQTTPDENKAAITDAGVVQHGKELDTLTAGMTPEEKQSFTDAYSVKATDTHAIATKRLEDAKAAAALSGGERDRALQRDIANKNHQDQMANHEAEQNMTTVQYRDKNGTLRSGSLADAKSAGGTGVRKIAPGDEQKARTAYTQYSRLLENGQAASDTMPAWDNDKDRQFALRIHNKFFEHAIIPGVGIDPNYVDSLLNSDDYRSMTPLGQKHMQNMVQLYSDAINMMKLETGGVPRGEQFLKTEGAILPSPEKSQASNYQALKQFGDRIKKDSSEYALPGDMEALGGIVPPDATHKLMKQGKIVGYTDKSGKDIIF